MSLNSTLQRLMGRNSDILLELFVFEIRAMFVLFNSTMGKLLLRTFRTILVILQLTIFQYFKENMADIPSGPGALVGWICLKAMDTSSLVKSRVRFAFISSVTLEGIAAITSSTRVGWAVV